MDIDKVRALSENELKTELATERRHLYDLRFQLATRQLTDHTQLTMTRRSIARILTVMTERDIEPIEMAPARQPRTTRRVSTRAKAATGSTTKTVTKATTAAKAKTAPKPRTAATAATSGANAKAASTKTKAASAASTSSTRGSKS